VIDDLILSTHLKSSDLTPLLLNLEFQGVLKCLPGKVYALI
jgi:predicted Rossmann fold nucleotide-binding protein DprA/Smf involved in DNA uptake